MDRSARSVSSLHKSLAPCTCRIYCKRRHLGELLSYPCRACTWNRRRKLNSALCSSVREVITRQFPSLFAKCYFISLMRFGIKWLSSERNYFFTPLSFSAQRCNTAWKWLISQTCITFKTCFIFIPVPFIIQCNLNLVLRQSRLWANNKLQNNGQIIHENWKILLFSNSQTVICKSKCLRLKASENSRVKDVGADSNILDPESRGQAASASRRSGWWKRLPQLQ